MTELNALSGKLHLKVLGMHKHVIVNSFFLQANKIMEGNNAKQYRCIVYAVLNAGNILDNILTDLNVYWTSLA